MTEADPSSQVFDVSDYQFGRELRLCTPGTYAMDRAIAILKFLEEEIGADVKNTGWKRGFGLEVARAVPIQAENVTAELETDGSEIIIRRVEGSAYAFDHLCSVIRGLAVRRV